MRQKLCIVYGQSKSSVRSTAIFFFSILLDTHDIRVNLKVIKSTLFKRVLTDVSAMAYLLQGTRLDTVKKFVNSVYVPECVHVHVPHVIARDGTRVIKQKVSNIWKSTSSPTSYGIPGWLDLHLIQQPCMSSSEWLAWLKWAGTERSFLLFMTSLDLRCPLWRSTNLYPVSQMYIVDGHFVRNWK